MLDLSIPAKWLSDTSVIVKVVILLTDRCHVFKKIWIPESSLIYDYPQLSFTVFSTEPPSWNIPLVHDLSPYLHQSAIIIPHQQALGLPQQSSAPPLTIPSWLGHTGFQQGLPIILSQDAFATHDQNLQHPDICTHPPMCVCVLCMSITGPTYHHTLLWWWQAVILEAPALYFRAVYQRGKAWESSIFTSWDS